jgi:hypothetical protein
MWSCSRSSPFTPLEKALLSDMLARLPNAAKDLFASQISAINLVQRHAEHRELCCYSMRNRKVFRDPATRFPATDTELKFATTRFSTALASGTWTVDFILVEGYFFSMVFDRSPMEIQNSPEILVQDAIIRRDPMLRAEDRSAEYYLRRINAKLPDDYLSLAQQAPSTTILSCAILPLSQVYEIVLSDSSYYVLAEVDGKGVLAVQEASASGLVYYLPYSGPEAIVIGTSLREALADPRIRESGTG